MCLALVLAMALLCFASCGIIKGDTVMEYEGYKITEAMYSYWASSFKGLLLSDLMSSGQYSSASESAIWSTPLEDGSTYGSFWKEYLDSYAKQVLVCQKLFDDYGLRLSEAAKTRVESSIEQLEIGFGGVAGLNEYLAKYNLNIKTLKNIYYAEEKMQTVVDYVFGTDGPMAVSYTEQTDYYKEKYYCVNWIYIYTEMKPDAENEGTGGDDIVNMVPLSESEKAEKMQLVEDILAKLRSGEESFAYMKSKYCEDKNADGSSPYDYYPNGFNLSANSVSDYGVGIIKTIQGMEIGSFAAYTDEYATRIIVRNPLKELNSLTAQEKSFMVDFDSYVLSAKSDKYFDSIEITVYADVMERYDVTKINAISSAV